MGRTFHVRPRALNPVTRYNWSTIFQMFIRARHRTDATSVTSTSFTQKRRRVRYIRGNLTWVQLCQVRRTKHEVSISRCTVKRCRVRFRRFVQERCKQSSKGRTIRVANINGRVISVKGQHRFRILNSNVITRRKPRFVRVNIHRFFLTNNIIRCNRAT